MKWNQAEVEQFFGGKFESTETADTIALRCSASGINYLLLMTKKEDAALVCLAADTRKHFPSTPLFESIFHCRRIDLTAVTGVGPILLFRTADSAEEDSLRLSVLRMRDGGFSISPQWPGEPWRKD